jgi:putative transposase
MNADRAWRLWRLAACKCHASVLAGACRCVAPAPAATGARHVWACDFVFDACANGDLPPSIGPLRF